MNLPDSRINDPGPYYVAILVNQTNGERVHIVHTFAEHFALVYNVLRPKEKWVLSQLMGPFGKRVNAEKFTSLLHLDVAQVCKEFNINHWVLNETYQIPDTEVLSLKFIKESKKKS